jgi:hypothetical protein
MYPRSKYMTNIEYHCGENCTCPLFNKKICIVKCVTNIIITHVEHIFTLMWVLHTCNPILSWAQYPLTKVLQKSISKCIYTYVYEIGEKKKLYSSSLKGNYYVSTSSQSKNNQDENECSHNLESDEVSLTCKYQTHHLHHALWSLISCKDLVKVLHLAY